MKVSGARRLLMVLLVSGMTVLQARMPLPVLSSTSALVQDQQTGELLVQKRINEVAPIASLTKLMTTMVVLDAKLDPAEQITILEEDKDVLRHSHSRLPVGTVVTRQQTMLLALMASENRAAHALGRTYPGGLAAFIPAMNAKAHALGLKESRFGDPAGLSTANVSSAMDLARIVDAAHHYPEIRTFSTTNEAEIPRGRGVLHFHNTNLLLKNPKWQIGLSKTGFINESGQCLVMQAKCANRPVLIVLLDATGKRSRFNDADRIRRWMEGDETAPVQHVARLGRHRALPRQPRQPGQRQRLRHHRRHRA